MTASKARLLLIVLLLPTSGFQLHQGISKRSIEPAFSSHMKNITVPIGKEAVLGCSVDNLGKHKVVWVRAEDQTVLSLQTKVVTHNVRVSVTHDNTKLWQLHIRQVRESDRGCYMCQINTVSIKTEQGCLDVYVPPDIMDDDTSGDLSAAEGENATLWCRATGHPSPRISWRREDSQPIMLRKGTRDFTRVDNYNGSSLYFWRLDRRQMGAYLCIASNEVPPAVSKRVSLNVHFAPAVKVPNQLLGAPLNTDVQLECYVEAYPATINYWVKNRSQMLLNGTKYHVREDRSTYKIFMWLTILKFSVEDIGTYNCISTNSIGKSEGTLRLYEIKVNPGDVNGNRISIVGGLAEPARGHRTNEDSASIRLVAPPLHLVLFLVILEIR